ncbi:MAG: helix-hairpin-helix domain-containing protein [Saprospiraceae bacterium]|nr:helix-hairpin-helix domain-containing protein [Saprospiraceae bacterium]
MRNQLFQYLHFTRKERNGTIVLLLLCAFVFALPDILDNFRESETTDFSEFRKEIQAFRDGQRAAASAASPELFYFNPNTASREDLMRLGLSEKTASMICKYRDKGGQFRRAEDFKKIWGLAAEDYERLAPFIRMGESGSFEEGKTRPNTVKKQFEFDPNMASEDDFRALGLPERTIQSILNYRSKGGRFRRREDFQKIYNLPEDDYERLESYIVIAAASSSALADASQPFAPKKRTPQTIDINLADADAWMTLPGIGEKRAQQLVRYRDQLGGFLSIEQVGQMYNLPDSVFQAMRPLLVLNSRDIRRIDLNTASLEVLDAHPYFSRKQAELIVNYRQQHGPYRTVEDIEKIIAFTDKAWIAKVKVYLKV